MEPNQKKKQMMKQINIAFPKTKKGNLFLKMCQLLDFNIFGYSLFDHKEHQAYLIDRKYSSFQPVADPIKLVFLRFPIFAV